MSAEPVPDLPSPAPARSRRGRALLIAAGLLLATIALALLWGRAQLVGSLPRMDGEARVAGLTAPVRVERDALGVPTIRAANRLDAARALGFLHAQERFFQMDLLRRRAAGELSELVGPAALKLDREVRVHRFRAVAQRTLHADTPEGHAFMEAYAAGVNAGLTSLGKPPFEYLVLRATPAPWRPEDSVLAPLAMFLELQSDTGEHESTRALLHDTLPPALADFLLPRGTEWDAPLRGEAFAMPPIPGPDVLDLRREPPKAAEGRTPAQSPWALVPLLAGPDRAEQALGSNNWAVAGTHTADGGALVAGDMHLGIGVPNTWYRASMEWPVEGRPHRVTGVTLPGAPAMVAGSTGDIAWAFTNTEGDWQDLVLLETDPDSAQRYRTPEGWKTFEHHPEVIHAKGAPDETLDVVDTVWGPVIDHDFNGRARVLHWTAHEAGAVNVGLLRMETARTVDEALQIAGWTGVPAQNFVCADRTGRIGWTVIGQMPRRVGFDGRLPTSWADGTRRWDGWLAPEEHPRVVDPPSGRVWSANSRVADGDGLALVGDEGYDLGARQRQIRDDLMAIPRATPADMLRVQLDDRALFLTRWHDLLLAELTPAAVSADPRRAEVRRLVEAWGGHASIDSAGYRLVRAWRSSVAKAVLLPLVARAKAADERLDYLGDVRQWEGPLWALVSARPAHLLDPRFASWDAALLSALDSVVGELAPQGPLAARTWGERNLSRPQHPLAAAVPFLSRWLDMPPRPLPGDGNMPRFQSPRSGASQRMAVSPGREAEGYFHMPVGQSGHPLSPHYGDGHDAWAEGRATPFLPGATVHVLTLQP